jgi:5'-nucleotidase
MNSPKLTILIDMDAVTADILKNWLPRINKDYNEKLSINNLNSWNITDCTKYASYGQVMHYLNEDGFFFNLDPIPGAIENLKKLQEEGFDIWFVTAPPYNCPHSFKDKLNWIEKYIPFIPTHRVIFTGRKYMIKGDILFDDSPTNLKAFPGTAVAYDYLFNQSHEGFRVKNWDEFYQLVHEIQTKRDNQVR